MQTFLKWPGGKRWLIQHYPDLFPEEYNIYYEPFVGGGAVFFSLLPNNAILSDINSELINLYVVMRDKPKQLCSEIQKHQKMHSKEYYYKIREAVPSDDVGRAGRMLYLNRTCYNGMYRVNREGVFNVPMGTKSNCTYDLDQFSEYSFALKRAKIQQCDFVKSIERTGKNDLIFADPPYKSSGGKEFIKYNNTLFTWNDQKRLLLALSDAKKRGTKVILTNANCQEIIDMYKDGGFKIRRICRFSTIAGVKTGRKQIEELLITSF